MIVLSEFQEEWAETFECLRLPIWKQVSDFALSVEHVGSTSVAGLVAKPVIDMGVVVAQPEHVSLAIRGLANLGYVHRGDRGIFGREAFHNPAGLPAHHLYVYRQGCLALRNHLGFRDYLRKHQEVAREYGELKRNLAREHAGDMVAYVSGKTDFILSVLAKVEVPADQLKEIDRMNRLG